MTKQTEPEDDGAENDRALRDPGEDPSPELSRPGSPETPDPESSPFEEPSGEWLGEAELEPEE